MRTFEAGSLRTIHRIDARHSGEGFACALWIGKAQMRKWPMKFARAIQIVSFVLPDKDWVGHSSFTGQKPYHVRTATLDNLDLGHELKLNIQKRGASLLP